MRAANVVVSMLEEMGLSAVDWQVQARSGGAFWPRGLLGAALRHPGGYPGLLTGKLAVGEMPVAQSLLAFRGARRP